MKKETKKKKAEPSIGKLADAAFRRAAETVIEVAERTGTPVIVWRDGEMKRLDPRKLRLELAKKKRKKRTRDK